MVRTPKRVEVKLDLKLVSISGTWEPNDAERAAAWELYVELITRVAVVPLENGLLREGLTSLYSLFATSRDVLRKYGPQVAEPKRSGEYSLGFLVVTMLNYALRPVLSYWHPELQAWEHSRAADCSPLDHERAWSRASELRTVLDDARTHLDEYAKLLAHACGVPDLREAVPPPAATGPAA